MVGTVRPAHPTQEWLDANQYSRNSILRYERIFGHNWVSTGGEKTTQEFCQLLNLKPGQKVLDVGCGTGGSAFYMAEQFGAQVVAVDLSSHMINIACERLAKTSKQVQNLVEFEIADITEKVYEDKSFDVVYSRDTILHIPKKEELYQKLKSYLKPGGQLFVTDYCRGDQQHTKRFQDYVAQRGYDLRTVVQYGALLEACGYQNVQAVDKTETFLAVLARELEGFEPTKEKFIQEFSEKDYTDIVDGWKAKQVRCKEGDQVWGMFHAKN